MDKLRPLAKDRLTHALREPFDTKRRVAVDRRYAYGPARRRCACGARVILDLMSHQSLEAMRQWQRAFREGDKAGVRALFSPDAVWDDRQLRPEGAIRRGPEVWIHMNAWLAAWDDHHWDFEDLFEIGDRVVAVVRERGIAKQSGLRIDHRVGLVCSFRDGLIVETVAYADPEQARAAAELAPRA
jgi:ketosteroid isomerase-like protein